MQIPHNIEAEVNLLGAVLFDNGLLDDVIGIIEPGHFYSKNHERIFQIILEHHSQNKTIDPVILVNVLNQRNLLDIVGGADYIASMVSEVFSSHHAREYARIVRDKAVRAALMRTCAEITANAVSSSEDVDEIVDDAQKQIFEIGSAERMKSVSKLGDVVNVLMDKFGQMRDGDSCLKGQDTGFWCLDELTNGFKPGEMIILAARPSVGKTTLAMNIAEYVAVEEKLPVLFFSLEMREEQIAQNLICSRVKVDMDKLVKGKLSSYEWTQLTTKSLSLLKAPLSIVDKPAINVMEIRSIARKMKKSGDLGLIIVDYLQIMGIPEIERKRGQSRENEISKISAALKALARDLEVPVIVLCQLNRDVEKRIDSKPKLHDLRESGSIEQDADIVMLLSRTDYQKGNDEIEPYNPSEGRRSTLCVAKNRTGKVGEIALRFFPHRLKFEDWMLIQ